MELQLGLSLSSSSASSQFDLNDCHDDNAQRKGVFVCMKMEDFKKRKLSVNGDKEEEEEGFYVPETLPLLFCNKSNQEHDDDDDDDVNEVQSTFIFINHKNSGGNGVLGKVNRKNVWQQDNEDSGDGGGSKSMYVKVHMEGDGIARKIDLNLHHSYHTLIHTLAHMFGKCNEDVKLTYQDEEGDWLLAGDVPWGSFVETVQRLKLLRSNS